MGTGWERSRSLKQRMGRATGGSDTVRVMPLEGTQFFCLRSSPLDQVHLRLASPLEGGPDLPSASKKAKRKRKALHGAEDSLQGSRSATVWKTL